MKTIAPYILIPTLIYLMISFFNMDLNAQNWHKDSRFIFIILTAFSGAFIPLIKILIKLNKNN